jgi:predicted acylesterase/phospholipase RssA
VLDRLEPVVVGVARVESSDVPSPSVSLYEDSLSNLGAERIRRTLERHVDFEAVPVLCLDDSPELVVGTVDVNAGVFETFTNEDVTTDAVLASAAVLHLFEVVELHGHDHWGGLFSQTSPVDDLPTVESHRKPEELWVVQTNPQELRGAERVNEWIDEGYPGRRLPEDHRVPHLDGRGVPLLDQGGPEAGVPRRTEEPRGPSGGGVPRRPARWLGPQR